MSDNNALGDQITTTPENSEACEQPDNINNTETAIKSTEEVLKDVKNSEVAENSTVASENCASESNVQKNAPETKPEANLENVEIKPENVTPVLEETQKSVENTVDIPKTQSDFERVINENKNLLIKIQNLEHDVQVRTEERENYKNKVHILETEVKDLKNSQPNTLTPSQQNAVEKMKKQSEEILTRAKGVIFDKTKLIKHQELQIETLTLQITSLKEVLAITKELLEIRNLEVQELQEKMNFMEQKIATEKLNHELMNAKMDTLVKLNSDLKSEYEIQLKLFNELRTAYADKEKIKKDEQQETSTSS